jgi:hypothetical protein
VTLVGFGTFSVGERAARVGRNPQTGAEIQIAASKPQVLRRLQAEGCSQRLSASLSLLLSGLRSLQRTR